ncbi:MAG: hypothetical protein QOF98_1591, partial [Streptomyces sp.]|nr:hypothetical protein [Streptomyces sp.]
MGVSRRTVLTTAVGGTAAAGLAALGLSRTASAASAVGDV